MTYLFYVITLIYTTVCVREFKKYEFGKINGLASLLFEALKLLVAIILFAWTMATMAMLTTGALAYGWELINWIAETIAGLIE
nr:MAG TPA: hypothetical protein [Caudoviricetes sp.]